MYEADKRDAFLRYVFAVWFLREVEKSDCFNDFGIGVIVYINISAETLSGLIT